MRFYEHNKSFAWQSKICLAAFKANADNLNLFSEMPETAAEALGAGFPARDFCAAWEEFNQSQRDVQKLKHSFKTQRPRFKYAYGAGGRPTKK